MNKNSTAYTFSFAVTVCVVLGVLLSTLSEGLRSRQELNAELDVKKNILKAVVLREPIAPEMSAQEILKVYEDKITAVMVDDNGDIVPGKKPAHEEEDNEGLHPVYLYKEGDQVLAYAIPIVGHGLWSKLFGYLAIEADGITIRGITFYKHGETPGLGGEIEKEWFQQNFVGKTIYDMKSQELTPIVVAKGKAADQYSGDALDYHVDGITAATLTGAGVTDMMDKWLKIYEPYLVKIRKG